MSLFNRAVAGWWALILIVILVVLAQVFTGASIIRKALWTAVAAIALLAMVSEWKR